MFRYPTANPPITEYRLSSGIGWPTRRDLRGRNSVSGHSNWQGGGLACYVIMRAPHRTVKEALGEAYRPRGSMVVTRNPVLPEDLVQVPDVSQPSLPTPEIPGVVGPKLPAPLSDGLVGYDDSPFRQKYLDVSEAQRESMIEPDGMTDDFGRESVSVVATSLVIHHPILQRSGSSRQYPQCRFSFLSGATTRRTVVWVTPDDAARGDTPERVPLRASANTSSRGERGPAPRVTDADVTIGKKSTLSRVAKSFRTSRPRGSVTS